MPTSPIATWKPGVTRLDPCVEPGNAAEMPVNLIPSTVFAAGTVLGRITASGLYKAYASGSADGSQAPTCILKYACATDAAGNVTFGTVPAGSAEWNQTQRHNTAYTHGTFRTVDLVGLDAGALTALGRLRSGTLASGEVVLYGP